MEAPSPLAWEWSFVIQEVEIANLAYTFISDLYKLKQGEKYCCKRTRLAYGSSSKQCEIQFPTDSSNLISLTFLISYWFDLISPFFLLNIEPRISEILVLNNKVNGVTLVSRSQNYHYI